jgi:hypothetical protein
MKVGFIAAKTPIYSNRRKITPVIYPIEQDIANDAMPYNAVKETGNKIGLTRYRFNPILMVIPAGFLLASG